MKTQYHCLMKTSIPFHYFSWHSHFAVFLQSHDWIIVLLSFSFAFLSKSMLLLYIPLVRNAMLSPVACWDNSAYILCFKHMYEMSLFFSQTWLIFFRGNISLRLLKTFFFIMWLLVLLLRKIGCILNPLYEAWSFWLFLWKIWWLSLSPLCFCVSV